MAFEEWVPGKTISVSATGELYIAKGACRHFGLKPGPVSLFTTPDKRAVGFRPEEKKTEHTRQAIMNRGGLSVRTQILFNVLGLKAWASRTYILHYLKEEKLYAFFAGEGCESRRQRRSSKPA